MRSSKDITDWILSELRYVNPYTATDKLKAFIWATGFLARCIAEMIWRDNHNLEIFRRIIDRNRPKR